MKRTFPREFTRISCGTSNLATKNKHTHVICTGVPKHLPTKIWKRKHYVGMCTCVRTCLCVCTWLLTQPQSSSPVGEALCYSSQLTLLCTARRIQVSSLSQHHQVIAAYNHTRTQDGTEDKIFMDQYLFLFCAATTKSTLGKSSKLDTLKGTENLLAKSRNTCKHARRIITSIITQTSVCLTITSKEHIWKRYKLTWYNFHHWLFNGHFQRNSRHLHGIQQSNDSTVVLESNTAISL